MNKATMIIGSTYINIHSRINTNSWVTSINQHLINLGKKTNVSLLLAFIDESVLELTFVSK